MLEQKKPLMLGKNRGEPMRACVHGEQDLGLQGIRLQDPPPRSGGWHKGHRHPRESSAALSQAPRCTAEGSPSKTVGTRSQAAKRSDIEGQYQNLILSEGKLL